MSGKGRPSSGRVAERAPSLRVAAASDGRIVHVAREALTRGNAVDAVVAAVLIAAVASPGVLLGPVQLLAGGAGAGFVAIDGRVQQPGRSAPRPRGFLSEEAVPDAARVGVPAMPAALAAALASLGTATLHRAAAPAVAWAKAHHPERARVMQALARLGAPALAESSIADELTAAGGRAVRGLLTPEDLGAVRPAVVRCDAKALLTVPWHDDAHAGPDGSHTQVVAAIDGRGLVAVACYEASPDGVAVPALGIVAPRSAAPVMRGCARVRPGHPRPAAAPIALRLGGGIVDLALGIANLADAEGVLATVLGAIDSRGVVEALSAVLGGRPVALARTRESARVVASA
jgi:hypothetical protein